MSYYNLRLCQTEDRSERWSLPRCADEFKGAYLAAPFLPPNNLFIRRVGARQVIPVVFEVNHGVERRSDQRVRFQTIAQ